MDLSVLFLKDEATVRRAFSLVPEYLTTPEDGTISYMDYGLQLGRRFRALKLWFVLRHFGAEGIRAKAARPRRTRAVVCCVGARRSGLGSPRTTPALGRLFPVSRESRIGARRVQRETYARGERYGRSLHLAYEDRRSVRLTPGDRQPPHPAFRRGTRLEHPSPRSRPS